MRNIFDKAPYRPVPRRRSKIKHVCKPVSFLTPGGFAFAEPWLGGRQPVQFSTSLSKTNRPVTISLLEGLTNLNL